MYWIRTGMQFGQAVKNVQRLRQIVTVFAKHGFADVVYRMGLGKFLPARFIALPGAEPDATVPQRLRVAFEELGPTFVKFGQLLSSRSDLLPEEFVTEFTRLQDNVQPLPYEVILKVIETELKHEYNSAFRSINSQALASASIAQVHEAQLHTGEKVVIKVQRPEIKKIIETDISLLGFLAKALERYVPESRILQPSIIVDEFFRTLRLELDFLIEANNIIKISENFKEFEDIVIPKVFRDLSTHRILTLEQLDGIRVNDLPALDAAGINKKKIVELGARAFFKSVMIDGLFHGDLHGGNLFILKNNRLGIIDFGIVGRLSVKARDQLANMVVALFSEDYEQFCYQYAELGASDPSIDFDNFQREVRNTLSPYLGMALAEVNVGRVLIEATKIATKYKIHVPGDWMIVFKAILTMEGMGRTLDPHFDVMGIGRELVKDLAKSQYSIHRLTKDVSWIAKDLVSLLQVLPRQVRWMFKKFNRDDFAFEIKSAELKEISVKMDSSSRRTSLSIVIAGLVVAAAVALQSDSGQEILGYPAVAVVMSALALLLLIRMGFI